MTTLLRRLGALTAAVAAFAALAVPAASAGSGPVGSQRAEVRAATARFHDVEMARAAGYVPLSPCVAGPSGAMGIHYVNVDLVMDGHLDPAAPEALLYAPHADGTPRLVGVEYLNVSPGSVFGQELEAGPNGLFALHAWTWQANPLGVFAPFNPNVSC